MMTRGSKITVIPNSERQGASLLKRRVASPATLGTMPETIMTTATFNHCRNALRLVRGGQRRTLKKLKGVFDATSILATHRRRVE